MARRAITDLLSVFPFWLTDVGPLSSLSLPIFNPLAGFTSITAPEIDIEIETIQEVNSVFNKHVVKRANINSMILTKGITALSTGFFEWVGAALLGEPPSKAPWALGAPVGGVTYRRNFLLVHFHRGPLVSPRTTAGTIAGSAERMALITTGVGAMGGDAAAAFAISAATETAGILLNGAGFGAFEFAARMPARSFALYGCIPKRYKSGSDFDALSSELSISEMEFELENIEEINLFG